ncbi:MAG: hypothetical protein Mars2KO_44430 [Maribacter sp.]
MLSSCKDTSAQNGQLPSENPTEQLYLAAIKLSSHFDYQEYYGDIRTNEFKTWENYCSKLVPDPYVNPMEYYLSIFEEDKRIQENKGNPFKLKEIRRSQKKKIQEVKEMAAKVDTENLVFYKPDGYRLKSFDANTNRFFLSGNYKIDFDIMSRIYYLSLPIADIEPVDTNKEYFDKSGKEAEALFEYFEKTKAFESIPTLPTSLNAKITYSLKKPKDEYDYRFIATVKKVELFKKEGWDEKVCEINF